MNPSADQTHAAQSSQLSKFERNLSASVCVCWEYGDDAALSGWPSVILNGRKLDWIEDCGTLSAITEHGEEIAQLRFRPPGDFSREACGHEALSHRQRHIVIEVNEGAHKSAIAVPLFKGNWCAWAIAKTDFDPAKDLLPFTLHTDHIELESPKTSILYVSQIFGHITAAYRLIAALPENAKETFFVAAKNSDNVPAVVEQMRHEAGLANAAVPLTYSDSVSGGRNILSPVSALWFLDQNPELLEQALRSRVVLSDLREEVAWITAIIESHSLPIVCLGLTYQWPQIGPDTDTNSLHPDVLRALAETPSEQEKLLVMKDVGLAADEAVTDWHSLAKIWKSGVRNSTALAVDQLITFSAVGREKREVTINNCTVLPARRSHTALGIPDSNKVALVLGSGDWTCRSAFCTALAGVASAFPNLQFDVIGEAVPGVASLNNLTFHGHQSPQRADEFVKNAGLVIIKPGHFSFEALADRPLLIAPADRLEEALALAKETGNPRPVAIAVEVDVERLLIAQEAFDAGVLGDVSPLISVPSAECLIEKLGQALTYINSGTRNGGTPKACGTMALAQICLALKSSTAQTRTALLGDLERIARLTERKSWDQTNTDPT